MARTKYADYISHYMGWCKLLDNSNKSLLKFSFTMVFNTPTMIIHYSLRKLFKGLLIIFIYMGDMIIINGDKKLIIDLKAYLHSKFHMNDLGTIKYFLRLNLRDQSLAYSLIQGNMYWRSYPNVVYKDVSSLTFPWSHILHFPLESMIPP